MPGRAGGWMSPTLAARFLSVAHQLITVPAVCAGRHDARRLMVQVRLGTVVAFDAVRCWLVVSRHSTSILGISASGSQTSRVHQYSFLYHQKRNLFGDMVANYE